MDVNKCLISNVDVNEKMTKPTAFQQNDSNDKCSRAVTNGVVVAVKLVVVVKEWRWLKMMLWVIIR